MEKFFNKKFFLEQHVKVEPDWRNKKALLDKLGYSA
jgi:GTP-binding protein Era